MLNWLLLRTLHTINIFAGVDSAYVVKSVNASRPLRDGLNAIGSSYYYALTIESFVLLLAMKGFGMPACVYKYVMVCCMLLKFLQCENGANSLYVQPAVLNWASHKFIYAGRQFKFIYAGRQLFLCPVTACSFTPGRSSICDLRQFFFGYIPTKWCPKT